MIFKVVFLVVMSMLSAVLFHHHFLALKKNLSRESGEFTRRDYIIRLYKSSIGFFVVIFGKKRGELFARWKSLCSPLKKKWSTVGLYACFSLLVFTGFRFALFGSTRMFGLRLMLHVSLGGLFAVCLAVTLLLQARNFFWTENNPETKRDVPLQLKKTMFWMFALAGFLLTFSALAMMLPVFSFKAQLNLFSMHRYSALAALVSAIVFLYVSFAEKVK